MLSLNNLLLQNTPAPTSQSQPMMTGDLTRGLESNPDAVANGDFTRALETQLDQLAEQLGLDGGLDIQHLASLDAQGLIAELQAIMQTQPAAPPIVTPTELTTPSAVNSDLGLTDAAKSLAALRLLLQAGMSATQHDSAVNQSPNITPPADMTLDDNTDHSTLSAITNELNQLARYWLEYPASPTSIENATDAEQSVNPVLEQAAAAWQSLSRRADQSNTASQLTTPAVVSSGELITPPTTVLQSNATADVNTAHSVQTAQPIVADNSATTTLLNAILTALNNTQPAV
ncbi:hypothetical protein HUU62_13615, partial [Rhodoferax sp. 4810]|nr:hypothetical protein [Rhodoferax jenense]